MSKQLTDNIPKMRNDEIIGLAKNRWLPSEVQLAIAKYSYARAHMYLAENEGLARDVRDYLWSDECNRGYKLKATMLCYGQYDSTEADKYRELYERYPSMWSRSTWRASAAFFGHYWYNNGLQTNNTPPDLLNRIYDERYDPRSVSTRMKGGWGYSSPRYELERLAKHKNVDLELAIKLSQCGIDTVQKIGFQKIVELS